MSEAKPVKEMPIEVRNTEGEYLSHCTRKRAAQMVSRQKARWVDTDVVELFFTKRDMRKICQQVLERDGYICYICEETLAPEEVTYDHVIPRIDGGRDEVDNLAVCCEYCNSDKANRNLAEYMLYLYAQTTLLLGGYKYEHHKLSRSPRHLSKKSRR